MGLMRLLYAVSAQDMLARTLRGFHFLRRGRLAAIPLSLMYRGGSCGVADVSVDCDLEILTDMIAPGCHLALISV